MNQEVSRAKERTPRRVPERLLEVGLGNVAGTSLLDLSPDIKKRVLEGTLDYFVLEPRKQNHEHHKIGALIGVSLQDFVRDTRYERFNKKFARIFIGNVLGEAHSGLARAGTLHDVLGRLKEKLTDDGEILIVESLSPDVADVEIRSLSFADLGYEIKTYRGEDAYMHALRAEKIAETPHAADARTAHQKHGISYTPYIIRLKKSSDAR